MSGWLRFIAIVSILVAPFTLEGPVAADDLAPPRVKPESGPWTPTGSFSFEGDDEKVEKLRQALSGIACHDLSSPQHRCLAVFDEGVEARYVTIEDGSYSLDDEKVILATGDGELDAEASATDGKHYYVTGSHSVRRKANCEANPSSRQVIRIAIDQTTGKARHEPADGPVRENDGGRLWSLMSQSDEFKEHVGKCLGGTTQGVDIEGLAIKDGRLYFGFRGPAKGGIAEILAVDADALFTGGDRSWITPIKIGKDLGIRDLQAVKDGFLLLIGPDDSEENKNKSSIISFWDGGRGDTAEAKPLAELDLTGVKRPICDKKPKPEALAVTEDAPDHYKIVVLPDGMCDGGPLAFRIER